MAGQEYREEGGLTGVHFLNNGREGTVMDSRFIHPFTSLIVGPSMSGKSTFLKKLLENSHQLISEPFTEVRFLLGTSLNQNHVFQSLFDEQDKLPFRLSALNVRESYGTELHKTTFSEDLTQVCETSNQKGEKLCLIFDDLMTELNGSPIIGDLFSKLSSHTNTSVFFVTQNLFHKGKKNGDALTVYRNTKYLILFDSALDQNTFSIIASRIGVDSKFLKEIARLYRYVIIRGGHDVPEDMKFISNIFNTIKVGDIVVPLQNCFVPLKKKK